MYYIESSVIIQYIYCFLLIHNSNICVIYMLKKLHFLSHGVTLVKPLSRPYYTGFRIIFFMSQEFVTVMNFVLFSFVFVWYVKFLSLNITFLWYLYTNIYFKYHL